MAQADNAELTITATSAQRNDQKQLGVRLLLDCQPFTTFLDDFQNFNAALRRLAFVKLGAVVQTRLAIKHQPQPSNPENLHLQPCHSRKVLCIARQQGQ